MCCVVDWVTLVSTVSGAVLALGGTVIAYVFSARDRRSRENRGDRRQSYIDYILAVEAAHSALRRVADPNRTRGDLSVEAAEAMTNSGVYGAREKLLVTADRGIVRAGETTLEALSKMRRAARHGATLDTLEWHNAYHQYAEAVWALRRAARTDLGADQITPDDLGKLSWDSQQNCDFCRHALAKPAQAKSAVPAQPSTQ